MAMLLLSLGAAPPSLSYRGSGEVNEQYLVTQHDVGVELGLAVDGVNLRGEPRVSAEAVASLPLGAAVKVLGAGAALVRVDQRVDRWYQVEVLRPEALAHRRGFVFGAALTPLRLRADLDGDGTDDDLAVSWTWNFKVRVRVRTGAEPARLETIDLEPAGQAYACCGGTVTAELVPRSKAGLSLVLLGTNPEACGETAEHYVSFVSVKGAPPRLREALRASGLSDPPSYGKTDVRFDAKARTVTLTQRSWSEEETDDQGRPKVSVTTSRLKLTDGVYRR
jgi:hypothetical protein